MINPFQTRFGAIFQNEVLLNSKRVAPYALMILFAAYAVLLWGRGPAIALGWATNSDFYIARNLLGFSFLALPILDAIIMGDPVIRDFRLDIDPLIFSKPVNRAQYLFGKFSGNFFVLVCCMTAFPLSLLALQAFRPSQMIVQPLQVLTYFKHFFFFVVITHLALAACYFTAGTLTRNSKVVYGLAISFYPIYIAAMVFLLRPLPIRWRSFFDPFLLNSGPSNNGFGNSADYLNQYIVSYTPDMIWNRVLLILSTAVCLGFLYLRFTTAERSRKDERSSTLNLSASAEAVAYDAESFQEESLADAAGSGLYRHRAIVPARSLPNQENKTEHKVISSIRTFAAIAYNEVLLNSKRVAPYAIAILCAGNGLLWWGWGPATGHRWAVNADFFIASVLPVYSFLFLPLYTALMMADPAIRDFRVGIDPLIFSKPISRAAYLLGKFFGNFFVLACCQSAFVLTWFVLQAVPKQGVITQQWKVIPYIKHFLVFVVISHLGLAAFYFAVGVLSRNAKIVYGLGVAFYPLYIAYQKVLLSSLPWRWKLALDPLVMNRGGKFHAIPTEVMNHLVVVYEPDLIVNRAVMILMAAICLTIVYLRFAMAERPGKVEKFSVLNLSTAAERVYYDLDSFQETHGHQFETPGVPEKETLRIIPLPEVARANEGIRANVNKLIAALGTEFRLLHSERSLVVILPLAIAISTLEVAFWRVTPDPSFSAAYADNAARSLLLFMLGITIFYTGETMHRDDDLRIEPMLWSQPIPNYVLLLSKFLATMLLTLALVFVVALITITLQSVKHNSPIELSAYLRIYGIILIPNAIFLAAAALGLNVLLRDLYLTYAASIGICGALFYLYSQGHNHWLYNPLLFQLWRFEDLIGGPNHLRILDNRLYILILAVLFIGLAHLRYRRNSSTTLRVR